MPGVTSISADLHKYGFAAKGASTITYRNLELLKHQMFVCQDWPGGVFASPALLGTRPGGAYAAAWAAMQHFGIDGYRDLAARTSQAFERMRAGVEAMPELKVLGEPQGPLLAYGSATPEVNIFAVGDQMDAKGWQVNRLQFPDGLHAMITAQPPAGDRRLPARPARGGGHGEGRPQPGGQGPRRHLRNDGAPAAARRGEGARCSTLFANAYRAGGAPLDLEAHGGDLRKSASRCWNVWQAGTLHGNSGVSARRSARRPPERHGRAQPPPKTFFNRLLPAPSGSLRSFFSSSPIIRNRPSRALPVT